ncbi:hypothetical protein A2U01_0066313, partial [Trifolium medium]|nr:hypothetical protein [Trifolium medium]
VLEGRQMSPGEVVARMSPAVDSRRQLRHFILTCVATLSPGETRRQELYFYYSE